MSGSDSVQTPVASSLLSSVAYSPQATLEIVFRSGAIYRYFLVPRSIFEGLTAAESKGAYFNRHVKTAFRYERIS